MLCEFDLSVSMGIEIGAVDVRVGLYAMISCNHGTMIYQYTLVFNGKNIRIQ